MEHAHYLQRIRHAEDYLCSWVEVLWITLAPCVSSYIAFISVPLAEHKSLEMPGCDQIFLGITYYETHSITDTVVQDCLRFRK